MHRSLKALLTLLALSLCACAGEEAENRAYCDDTGCYTCDGPDACSPLPNQRCAADSECKTGQRCTTIGCAAACKADSDCQDPEVCVSGYCAPDGFNAVKPYQPSKSCTNDSQCAKDQFCQQNQKKCIPRCKSDDDCSPGSVCTSCGKCQSKTLPATCGEVPVYCSAAASCGKGKVCVSGRCHFTCTQTVQCPLGQMCTKGRCLDDPKPAAPDCVLDLDCVTGSCINGTCHPACTSSATCGQGELCQMGLCQPDYFPAS